jgi:hypothetical protein
VKEYVILTTERVKALKGIGFVLEPIVSSSWEERLTTYPNTAKSTGTAMFPHLNTINTSWIRGSQPKEENTGCTRRKDIAYDALPNQSFKIWVSNGACVAPGKTGELVDYRKFTGTAMFLRTTAKNIRKLLGRNRGSITSCIQEGKTKQMALSCQVESLGCMGP